ncbi:Arogenate dehydrogenase [Carbonactinospora thermoautotrophica]|uniref:Prephenate dehydrogenase n=1 Tax=Carbonactinospora thermoautotrophica TaxID=1469144 RepID=A0A132MSP1_9ACTN|nr:prephenate dehydrogenase [Carbonactinospora thermoautotrophica]KWX00829.1 Arogenate dehydrogenase [Carbonactinospora thermoautotrophica]
MNTPDSAPTLRTALVVGTGLIGTSVALALSSRGVATYLADTNPAVARFAAELGAGRAEEPPGPVDLAILGVPPTHVGRVLADLQARDAAAAYTDVASVKALPLGDAERLGCDLCSYVGGHPMAGRERSGPAAARGDLFEGRPWVLTPSPHTSPHALAAARELARLCGALPIEMDPAAHDHAVALVSHAPHLVSSLMAARLADAADEAVRLCGQGIRDVTRIAASDPALWVDILSCNAAAVADVLEALGRDLDKTVTALRALAAGHGSADPADLTDVLKRGNAGVARIPGKHGAPPARYAVVPVIIGDRPGELARLFTDVGEAGVNIEDLAIEHSPGQPVGLVEISVEPAVAATLTTELRRRGWTVQE